MKRPHIGRVRNVDAWFAPVIKPWHARLDWVRSGQDFSSYKENTLQRRINRRMGLADVKALPDYAELLRTNPDEINALVKDLMISVTGFFRDPEAWRTLDEMVLARLVAERAEGTEIRLSPGGFRDQVRGYARDTTRRTMM